MAKPTVSAIRSAAPLSASPFRAPDPMERCNICGEPAREYRAWRECDDRDRPVAGAGALIFIGADHAACQKKLDAHPRLYAEERGNPGHFPRLCSRCSYRDHLGCRHPKLKANGGEGLLVHLDQMAMIVCLKTAHGSGRPLSQALTCEGQTLPGEASDG